MLTFPSPAVRVLALLLLLTVTVGGCAWTQEERDFYSRGWINPRELDRPAPYRGPRPVGETSADRSPVNPWTTPDPARTNRQ